MRQSVTRHARDGSRHFKIYVWSIEEFAGLINSKPPITEKSVQAGASSRKVFTPGKICRSDRTTQGFRKQVRAVCRRLPKSLWLSTQSGASRPHSALR